MSLHAGRFLKNPTTSFRPIRTYFSSGTRAFHASSLRSVLYNKPNDETFVKLIGAEDRITLVDFYADWCAPCKHLAPVVEKLTNEPHKSGSGLSFDLVKVDTDSPQGQILSGQFSIRALPTVIAFRGGTPVSQFVGALNEAGVKQFLDEL